MLSCCRCDGAAAEVSVTDDPAAPKPFTGDSTRLESSIDKGVLRIADKGTQRGDMVTWRRAWCADPADGATVSARVKVLNCTGLAGVMVGFSDGVHEDILTLYTDRIELYHAKLSFPMNTTDRFHEYRIDIRNTDVTITVDAQPAIRGKGAFAFPAHRARNRISIGGGASRSTGEALWDWVSWTDGLTATRLRYPIVAGAEHIVIFKEEGVYAPFPGLSVDPETGFLYTTFAKKTRRTHHKTTNATRGTMGSRDGGRTWSDVPRVPENARGPHRGPMFKASDGALITIGQNWRRWFPPEREAEFKGKYRITRPGTYKPNWFAFTSGGYVRRSADGGKTWSRADISGLDTYVSCSSPWSLLQLKDGRVLRTFMVLSGAKDSGDVFAAITADGRTAEVARIMGDPDEKLRFTEETLVHETSKGVIWEELPFVAAVKSTNRSSG